MAKEFNKKNWIVSSLRRASYRWPPRAECERLARKDRGLYECNMCKGLFKRGQYAIDHIAPVVSFRDGWTNWDDFINRLFCDVQGLQILCHSCHDAKTQQEDAIRAAFNAKRKEEEKLAKKLQKDLYKNKKNSIIKEDKAK